MERLIYILAFLSLLSCGTRDNLPLLNGECKGVVEGDTLPLQCNYTYIRVDGFTPLTQTYYSSDGVFVANPNDTTHYYPIKYNGRTATINYIDFAYEAF